MDIPVYTYFRGNQLVENYNKLIEVHEKPYFN